MQTIKPIIFFLVWLGFSGLRPTISAQVEEEFIPAYPIRVDHKWGYINIYDSGEFRIHRKPKYDFIGDINLPWNTTLAKSIASPFKIYALEDKVGVMNDFLEEILPNKYQRIRAVSPNYFAVEIDSLFQLINLQERILLGQQRYHNICLANKGKTAKSDLFFVKQEGLWGVAQQTGEVIIPPQYPVIATTDLPGFFKVKKGIRDTTWQLIDLLGKSLLSTDFKDVKIFSKQLIAVKVGQAWFLQHSPTGAANTFVPDTQPFKSIEKINPTLVQFQAGDKAELTLRDAMSNEILQTHALRKKEAICRKEFDRYPDSDFFPWYFPLDDKYSIENMACGSGFDDNSSHLINNEGKRVSPPFEHIIPSGKPYIYRVQRQGKWGLFAPAISDTPILSCSYQAIEAFQGNIAICRGLTKFGAFSENRGIIDTLPSFYNSMELIDASTVEVQLGDQDFFRFQLNKNGQFAKMAYYDKGISYQKNSLKMQEATPVFSKQTKPAIILRRERLIIRKDSIFNLVETRENPSEDFSNKVLYFKHALPAALKGAKINKIINDSLLAYFPKVPLIQNKFTALVLGARAVQPIQIANVKQAKTLIKQPIIGFRPFQKKQKHTAFIHPNGKMGLIDRAGNKMEKDGQPLQFVYIGPFINNLARVCLNGHWGTDKKNKKLPVSFKLTKQHKLIKTFRVKPYRNNLKSIGELYLLPPPNEPLKWGYINQKGTLVITLTTDYAADFNQTDSTAFIYDKTKHAKRDYLTHHVGVIDHKGTVIIPKEYVNIDRTPSHFIVSQENTPVFYYTNKGQQIFVNKYRPLPFSEGMAQFKGTDGTWGYVNRAGEQIPPQYRKTRPFSDGTAMVVDSSGFCGFIDQKGQLLFQTKLPAKYHKLVGDFHEGRCWFMDLAVRKWGCYDKMGTIIIPPKYLYKPNTNKKGISTKIPHTFNKYPMDFSQGIAVVKTADHPKKAVLIDKNGAPIPLAITCQSIGSFNQYGLAIFIDTKNKQGLINKTGKIITKQTFLAIAPFQNGFAPFQNETNQWGLLDTKGQIVVAPKYLKIAYVAEGLAAIQITTGEWRFLNIETQVVLPDSFKKVQAFSKGFTMVTTLEGIQKIIDKTGNELLFERGVIQSYTNTIFELRKQKDKLPGYYVDESGNNLFSRNFGMTTPFYKGVAKIKLGKRKGYGAINEKGILIVPAKYANIHIHPDGNIGCNPQQFIGLIDKKGQTIIPTQYDRILKFNDQGLYRVERGEKIGYLKSFEGKRTWVWELQQ